MQPSHYGKITSVINNQSLWCPKLTCMHLGLRKIDIIHSCSSSETDTDFPSRLEFHRGDLLE